MKELDEALMDRTTASQTRKQKMVQLQSSQSGDVDVQNTLSFCEEGGFTYKGENSKTTSAPKKCEEDYFKSGDNDSSYNKRKAKYEEKVAARQEDQASRLILNMINDDPSAERSGDFARPNKDFVQGSHFAQNQINFCSQDTFEMRPDQIRKSEQMQDMLPSYS